MFSIDSAFEGGNAKLLKVENDCVLLDCELRDTVGDWFFWCFKITGAAGKTVRFDFASENRVGYFGAAVSYDLENWQWQYKNVGHEGKSFTYTFGHDENEVYFAHDMVYRPKRFYDFAEKNELEVKTLCTTEKGRCVPYVELGKGEECILLTARHHACESTGNYVLEGVLESMKNTFADKYRIICVPFVDLDGVCDGDQGKNRNDHDHNRDYIRGERARYASVAEIRRIADNIKVKYAFDFHSPWHLSGDNDHVFIPIKSYEMQKRIFWFSRLFEAENGSGALPHYSHDNVLPNEKWNTVGSPCFGTYMINAGAELAFTLETPYYIASGTPFSAERAAQTGRAFASALEKYDRESTLQKNCD